MTLAAIIAFAICFVAGPALCSVLLRLPSSLQVLFSMGFVTVTAIVMALRMQVEGHPLTALGCMWLAWVVGLSLFAKALLKRVQDPRLGRWIKVGALLATTLPWFGLATAEMMV